MTRLVAWFEAHPRAWAPLALGWALLLGLPSLSIGYLLDDHVHRYGMAGLPSPAQGLDLFSFTPRVQEELVPFIRRGPYPWWTDPALRVRFFRPLSSAFVQLDHALFPGSALAAHLHSVAWSLALVAAGLLVLRRLVPAGPARALAYLLFAAASSHWMPMAWLANRNALVATVPALLGFVAHLRWRQEGWRPGLPLSVLAWVLSLSAAEVSLAMLAYPVAFELAAVGVPWRRRLVGLAPLTACVAAYAVVYRLTLSGARNSGMYLDPLGSTGAYLANAPERLLALLGNLTAQVPVDVWLSLPGARPGLLAASAVGVAAVGLGAVSLHREDAGRLRFLVLAIGLSMLPAVAVFPMARQVLAASLAGAALLAWLTQRAWQRGRRGLVVLVLGLHLGVSSLAWFGSTAIFTDVRRRADAALANIELEREWEGLRVLVLTSPDPAAFLYSPMQRAADLGSIPRAWWILTQGQRTLDVTRTGPGTLEVEVVGGRLVDGSFEQVVRSPDLLFAVGDRVPLNEGAVEVLAVSDGLPTRLRVELDGGLDAPDVRVLAWRDGTFRRFALPAVGQTVRLLPSPGPLTP